MSRRVAAALDDLGASPDDGWATLRQAESASGIASSTIRNWARKGKVASRLEQRADGPRRMVRLGDVVARAQKVDTPPPAPVSKAGTVAADVPEGQMLVPLDAWERMLIQLGNLHEAGQQLADAKERAAKAETETSFLRERIAEIRGERDQLRERVGDIATRPQPVAAPSEPEPASQPLWKRVLGEIRSRPKW